MTRTEKVKKIIGIAAAVLLIVAIIIAAIPACRNAVIGMFAGEDTPATPAGPQAPVDTDADGDGDADADGNTDADAEADAEVARPFSFEEFINLAITKEGMLNVPPQGAKVYDLTNDEFAAESDAEKAELYAVKLRVNPYGAMTIVQEGYEQKPNHDGVAVAPVFQLCNCAEKHGAWDDDFGQFHWTTAEGNEALGPKSWTRMYGEMAEVLLDLEAREMLRAAACYWYTVDAEGDEQIVYGIRVCGDQRDPELPKPEEPKPEEPKPEEPKPEEPKPEEPKPEEPKPEEPKPEEPKPEEPKPEEPKPEKAMVNVSYKFVATYNRKVPQEVMKLLPATTQVEIGTKVPVINVTSTQVRVANGVWYFCGWDKTQATANADVVFTGTWRWEEDLYLLPPPSVETEEDWKTVLDKEEQDQLDNLFEDLTPDDEYVNTPAHPAHPEETKKDEGLSLLPPPTSNNGGNNKVNEELPLLPPPTSNNGSNNKVNEELPLLPPPTSNNGSNAGEGKVADQATQDRLNALFGF